MYSIVFARKILYETKNSVIGTKEHGIGTDKMKLVI